MAESRLFNQFDAADHGQLKVGRHFSFGGHREANRMGGVTRTCLAIALRGLLVTTTAVGIVAYLLLTQSHI